MDTFLTAHVYFIPFSLLFQAQPEAATEDAVASGPRLNEQLSSKARHPSVIPGSFYERDQEFKEQSAGKGKPLTVVPPRTEGTVR